MVRRGAYGAWKLPSVTRWFSHGKDTWIYGLLALLLLVMLFGGFSSFRLQNLGSPPYTLQAGHLDYVEHPRTKPQSCYDCESSTGSAYMANKSKCFQCEDQVGGSSGWANAGAAQNTKCFTCGENKLLWRDGLLRHKRPILGQ